MEIPKIAKIVYRQMPAPRELSQQIPAPRAKARMQKSQSVGKFLVQIPGDARGGGMVMDEIDTCIIIKSKVQVLPMMSCKKWALNFKKRHFGENRKNWLF